MYSIYHHKVVETSNVCKVNMALCLIAFATNEYAYSAIYGFVCKRVEVMKENACATEFYTASDELMSSRCN